MSNKEYAARMRQEAEKWDGIILVDKAEFLRIADRIEASADSKGSADFKGFSYER